MGIFDVINEMRNRIELSVQGSRLPGGTVGRGLTFESTPNDGDLAIKRRMISGEARWGNGQSFLGADAGERRAYERGTLAGNHLNVDSSNLTSGTNRIQLPFGGHLLGGPSQRGGFGIDLDRDGSFQGNTDGVLAFDVNRDGTIDKSEMAQSNAILKSLRGEADFDADGKVSDHEMGEMKRTQQAWSGRLDLDGDGKLTQYELKRAGAKVMVDQDCDGNYRANDIDGVRTQSGTYSVKSVDLQRNYTEVENASRGGRRQHSQRDWCGFDTDCSPWGQCGWEHGRGFDPQHGDEGSYDPRFDGPRDPSSGDYIRGLRHRDGYDPGYNPFNISVSDPRRFDEERRNTPCFEGPDTVQGVGGSYLDQLASSDGKKRESSARLQQMGFTPGLRLSKGLEVMRSQPAGSTAWGRVSDGKNVYLLDDGQVISA
ncbi:EF-hand domain-containing protein [bacterium]|nr:EF-hand domain-containing protein [bacterium]